MIMTMHDKLVYDNSTLCHICNGELNTRFKVFPVVFHNLSGYHSHILMKTLGNSEGDTSGIANNKENYISFTKQFIVDKFVKKERKEINVKREFRFIDCLRFMA